MRHKRYEPCGSSLKLHWIWSVDVAAIVRCMTSNLHYIMRFCADDANPDHRKVIRDGLTLDEAQAHCEDERTHGDGWFDGYQVGEPVSPVQQPTRTAPLPAELGGVDVGRTATKPSEMGHDYTLTDEQL